MTTFEELSAANPNIREQYDTWRVQRANDGEDAADWNAFRAHVQGLGAPDPGDTQPDDWVGPDYQPA